MDSQIDLAAKQGLFDFLCKYPFAPKLVQGSLGASIAGGADHLDGYWQQRVGLAQPAFDEICLPQGKRAASRAYDEGASGHDLFRIQTSPDPEDAGSGGPEKGGPAPTGNLPLAGEAAMPPSPGGLMLQSQHPLDRGDFWFCGWVLAQRLHFRDGTMQDLVQQSPGQLVQRRLLLFIQSPQLLAVSGQFLSPDAIPVLPQRDDVRSHIESSSFA